MSIHLLQLDGHPRGKPATPCLIGKVILARPCRSANACSITLSAALHSPYRREEEVVARYIQYTASSVLLAAAFDTERRLGRWVRWPFGIKCMLVSRRPAHRR